ncbi:hypothetical protein MRX96_051232 [Rhipicephalus microplus]
MLAEVEAIVNCHPLAQLYEDAENARALTPSYLLTGKHVVRLPASTSGSLPSYIAHELRRRPSSSSQLHVGDLVVVRDEKVPALQWKLGRVVEAFPGRDGLERYFKIAFPNGHRVHRAAQRLFPL